MWNDRFSNWSLWGRAAFDPVTLTTMALTAVGTGLSAAGTLASGSYAKTAADYKATQLESNASGEIAAGQRSMFDKQLQTRLTLSSLTAKAGASGVDASVGSPVTASEEIAQRGEYQSLMDLWQGQNRATGTLNEAKAIRYTGAATKKASYLAAGGQIASGLGSMGRTYGRLDRGGGGGGSPLDPLEEID